MRDFDPDPPRLKDDPVAALLYVLLSGYLSGTALARAVALVSSDQGPLAEPLHAGMEARAFELAGQLPWYGGA